MSHNSSPRMQVIKLEDAYEPWPHVNEKVPVYEDYKIQTVTTFVPYNVYIPVGVPIMPPPRRLRRFWSSLGRKRHPRYPTQPVMPPMCYSPIAPPATPMEYPVEYPMEFYMAIPEEEIAAYGQAHMMPLDPHSLPAYPPYASQSLYS
ncbi:hypothetical protein NQZ79_g373 [Umbelopsis isabellina]|nr:hypothetical protein NQZ79_g373 [Umbelopsis isabellina]